MVLGACLETIWEGSEGGEWNVRWGFDSRCGKELTACTADPAQPTPLQVTQGHSHEKGHQDLPGAESL